MASTCKATGPARTRRPRPARPSIKGNFVGLDADRDRRGRQQPTTAVWVGGADRRHGRRFRRRARELHRRGQRRDRQRQRRRGLRGRTATVIGLGSDGSECHARRKRRAFYALARSVSRRRRRSKPTSSGWPAGSASKSRFEHRTRNRQRNRRRLEIGICAKVGEGGGREPDRRQRPSKRLDEYGILVENARQRSSRQRSLPARAGQGSRDRPPLGGVRPDRQRDRRQHYRNGKRDRGQRRPGDRNRRRSRANREGSWTEVTRNRGAATTASSSTSKRRCERRDPSHAARSPRRPRPSAERHRRGTGRARSASSARRAAEAGELAVLPRRNGRRRQRQLERRPTRSIPGGTHRRRHPDRTEGGDLGALDRRPPADPSGDSGGGSEGGGNRRRSGNTPDTTAPKVTITKAPKAKSTSTTAKFKFKANEAGSNFQCKLDKGKFKNCRSPKTYKKLKPGQARLQGPRDRQGGQRRQAGQAQVHGPQLNLPPTGLKPPV